MTSTALKRDWNGRSDVDGGIRTEWLKRMNGLKFFRPYFSCEGHMTGGYDHARMSFSVEDPTFIKHLEPIWNDFQTTFQSLVSKHFPPETTKKRLNLGQTRDGIGLDLHLDHVVPRQTEEMPESVAQWFEDVTTALPKFEAEFVRIVDERRQGI